MNNQLVHHNLKKKKILIFSDYPWVSSGCWGVLKNYLKILKQNQQKYELDIHIAFIRTYSNAINEEHIIPETFKISHILTELEVEFMERAWYTAGHWCYVNDIRREFNRKALDLINNYAPDIIIDFDGNNIRFDDFLASYDLAKKIPLVKFIHGKIWLDIFNESLEYYKCVLPKNHIMVCLNDDMKQMYLEFTEKNQIKNKEVTYLYNPIDFQKIQGLRSQQEDNETESLLNEDFIIAIGRDDLQKNYKEMLEIYNRLKQNGIKHKLYILGMDPVHNSLISQIQQLGLENDVKILGIKSNVYRFLEKAKLLIHTAIHEGLCGVIIESLACATPVVVMDCPTGMREILDGGKYGMLVPLHDQEQFIQKVELLLNNADEYEKYVQLSIQRAKDFDISHIEEQFLSLLDRSFNYTI